MEAIHSSETSVFTRCTRRHIPENGFLHFRVRSGGRGSDSIHSFGGSVNARGQNTEAILDDSEEAEL
jgi:hypothetical protein